MARVFGIAALVVGLCFGIAKADPPPAAPARPAGGAIVGRVTRGGQPIVAEVRVRKLFGLDDTQAGVRCQALTERMLAGPDAVPTVATAHSDAQGLYTVEGLDPAVYEAVAIDAEGIRTSRVFTIPVAGVRLGVDLPILAILHELHGRLRMADGKPFRGSLTVMTEEELKTETFDRYAALGVPATVNGEGKFVARGLAPGTCYLAAVVPGRMILWSDAIAVPSSAEVSLVVDAGLEPLRTQVVADDDGKPIAGAVLYGTSVMSESGARAVVRGTSDEGGWCVLPRALPPRFVGVWAYAPGFAEGRLDYGCEGKKEIVVRLRRPARVVGRVTRASDGTPAAGLTVRVAPVVYHDGWPVYAVTDAEGRYAVDGLDPGEVTVHARGPGWVTKDMEERESRKGAPFRQVLEPGATTTVDLLVVPATRVVGRVLDAEGRPVAGALVQAIGSPGGISWKQFGPDAILGESAASRADGSFAFGTLVGGSEYEFSAAAPGHLPVEVPGMRLSKTVPISLEMQFAPARRIEITLVDDATGKPVIGAKVELFVYSSQPRAGSRSVTVRGVTGTDGRYTFDSLPEGNGGFKVRGAAHAPQSFHIAAESGSSHTFRVKTGLPLAGRVLMPDGLTPARGAAITINTSDLYPPQDPETIRTTGADGRFRFERLVPGRVGLAASLPTEDRKGWIYAAIETEPGHQGLELVLAVPPPPPWESPHEPILVLRVTDSDGRPVPRAHVVIDPSPGGYAGAHVEDGIARIEEPAEVPPHDMIVKVDCPEDAKGNALPLAPVDVLVPRGAGEVTIVLPRERRIVGRVVDPGGAGVGGVKVRAVRSSHHRPIGNRDFPLPESTTDADGRFDIGGLADEEHVLLFWPPHAYAPEVPPRARAGATDVVVTLRPAVTADVLVLDAAGVPVARVYVKAYPVNREIEGGYETQSTDSAGVAHFEGLDPSIAYHLLTEGPSDDSRQEDASIRGWKPGDTTLRLGAARNVHGTVRDASGRPLGGISVYIDEGGGPYGGITPWKDSTKPDGSFSFVKVHKGEWPIVCWTRDWAGPSRRTILPAGADSIDIVLDPGLTLTVHVRNRHDPDKDHDHSTVLWSESDTGAGYLHAGRLSEDGSVVFGGLKAGETYRVVVTAVGGFSATRGGLRPGDDAIVALTRGGTVRGHVFAPPRAGRASVWIAAGSNRIVETSVDADGSFVLDGVPEGRWPIYALKYYAGTTLVAEGMVEDGGEIDLTLAPR